MRSLWKRLTKRSERAPKDAVWMTFLDRGLCWSVDGTEWHQVQ